VAVVAILQEEEAKSLTRVETGTRAVPRYIKESSNKGVQVD
jgi:hypothetical protein